MFCHLQILNLGSVYVEIVARGISCSLDGTRCQHGGGGSPGERRGAASRRVIDLPIGHAVGAGGRDKLDSGAASCLWDEVTTGISALKVKLG